jgi:hypothetical protein
MVTQTADPVGALAVAHEAAAVLGLPVTPERILLPRIFRPAWPVAPADTGARN